MHQPGERPRCAMPCTNLSSETHRLQLVGGGVARLRLVGPPREDQQVGLVCLQPVGVLLRQPGILTSARPSCIKSCTRSFFRHAASACATRQCCRTSNRLFCVPQAVHKLESAAGNKQQPLCKHACSSLKSLANHLQALQGAVAAAVVDRNANGRRQLDGDASLLQSQTAPRLRYC